MTGSDCRAGKIANAKPGSRNDAEDHGHEGHNRDRFDANFLEANAISIGVQADAACMKKSGDHGNACGDSEWEYCVAEEVHSDVLTHRSEEHTSELQSLMRISYAVFCLKKKTKPHRSCSRLRGDMQTSSRQPLTDNNTQQ